MGGSDATKIKVGTGSCKNRESCNEMGKSDVTEIEIGSNSCLNKNACYNFGVGSGGTKAKIGNNACQIGSNNADGKGSCEGCGAGYQGDEIEVFNDQEYCPVCKYEGGEDTCRVGGDSSATCDDTMAGRDDYECTCTPDSMFELGVEGGVTSCYPKTICTEQPCNGNGDDLAICTPSSDGLSRTCECSDGFDGSECAPLDCIETTTEIIGGAIDAKISNFCNAHTSEDDKCCQGKNSCSWDMVDSNECTYTV